MIIEILFTFNTNLVSTVIENFLTDKEWKPLPIDNRANYSANQPNKQPKT